MSILTRQRHSDNRQSRYQLFSLPDAQLALWPQWLDADTAARLYAELTTELAWQQERILMFGKPVLIPRRQVWMGDAHCRYRYSGVTFQPQPWHPAVRQLAQQLSDVLQQPFNCVLLNLYDNGQQHMGWHSDNEVELGNDPYIASVSLGATRRFELRHRTAAWQLALDLTAGSLLTMGQGCQHHWLHRLPKQSRVHDARLNLTFRYIRAMG